MILFVCKYPWNAKYASAMTSLVCAGYSRSVTVVPVSDPSNRFSSHRIQCFVAGIIIGLVKILHFGLFAPALSYPDSANAVSCDGDIRRNGGTLQGPGACRGAPLDDGADSVKTTVRSKIKKIFPLNER